MTEETETEFEYGDYDLPEDVTPVPASEALPYYDTEQQDNLEPEAKIDGVAAFTSVVGVTPEQAVDTANRWRKERLYFGVGQCLRTVRQFYKVPSKYWSAAASWQAADHKHYTNDGRDCPRGTPVWWTGGSRGAGHVAISCGGGVCITTDWKEPGRLSYARIDDITSQWGLDFKGYTREVNDVVVWRPKPPRLPGDVVRLSNLKRGKRNDDVLKVKKRLRQKGYRGFLVTSRKYGGGIQKAYAKYQRRLGYSGSDANGIPGTTSLKKLGFVVKP